MATEASRVRTEQINALETSKSRWGKGAALLFIVSVVAFAILANVHHTPGEVIPLSLAGGVTFLGGVAAVWMALHKARQADELRVVETEESRTSMARKLERRTQSVILRDVSNTLKATDSPTQQSDLTRYIQEMDTSLLGKLAEYLKSPDGYDWKGNDICGLPQNYFREIYATLKSVNNAIKDYFLSKIKTSLSSN